MKTILVVEDDKDFRENLAEILRLEQYCTLEAENGLSGLRMTKDHLPDLIICDIDMPTMNGIEMLIAAKLDRGISKIPFMFITGYSDGPTQKAVKGLGADLCLTKSVSMDHIVKVIHDLLNIPGIQ